MENLVLLVPLDPKVKLVPLASPVILVQLDPSDILDIRVTLESKDKMGTQGPLVPKAQPHLEFYMRNLCIRNQATPNVDG